MMAVKKFATLLSAVTLLNLVISAESQTTNTNSQQQGFGLSNVPGTKMAAEIAASASDGMSRYLAPDGPIQPAITAISGLPMRAGEMANSGLTSISSDLNQGAQRFSRLAGQQGQIPSMPGLDTAASMSHNVLPQLGEQVHGMIRQKNNFIRGQAERGIEAANRMGESMRRGLSDRSSGPLQQAGSMMSSAHAMMNKGGEELKNQLHQSLSGTMKRLQGMQGFGSDLSNQVSGYGRTLSQGVQGVSGQIRQTGQQLMAQAQQNHNKNMSGMGNMISSLHGSMGQMGQNMQKNLSGLIGHASSAVQQLSSSLQTAAQAPMNVLSSLGSMKSSGSGGGRY